MPDPDAPVTPPDWPPALLSDLQALSHRFAWLIDHQGGVGVSELFTPDGQYELAGVGTLAGRAQIDDFYAYRRTTDRIARHVFSNLTILTADDARAQTCSVLTLYAANGAAPHAAHPAMVADYDDTLRLGDDGRWRFARRTVTRIFGEHPNLTGETT